ncbi:MAG: TolC family protein [Vulcanimicrobiaceae bacterium]
MIPVIAAILTMQSAIAAAVPRDPVVLAAAASVRVARADALSARAGAAPVIFETYAAAPQAGSPGTLTQRTVIVGISKSFAFPALTLSLAAAARSAAAAAQATLVQARYDAAMHTIDVYLSALVAREQAHIAEDAVTTAKQTLDAARLREKAGAGPKIDVDRALAAFASAQAAQAAAQGRRDAAFAALDLAVGIEPSARPHIIEPVPPTAPKADASAALAAALRARPDLHATEELVRAARAGVSAAYASYAPSLDLSAGRQRGLDAGSPISGGTVSVTLNLPLDTSGAIRAKVERARGALSFTQAQGENLARAVALQVETAVAQLRAAKAGVTASARAERAALAASNAAALGFSNGAVSAVDAIIAQSQYAAARGALAAARADAVRAFYALRIAEGVEPYAVR